VNRESQIVPNSSISAQPQGSLRGIFASLVFVRSFSRKGAKAQREKRIGSMLYLGSFAPLREMFDCGCAALPLLRLDSQRHCHSTLTGKERRFDSRHRQLLTVTTIVFYVTLHTFFTPTKKAFSDRRRSFVLSNGKVRIETGHCPSSEAVG